MFTLLVLHTMLVYFIKLIVFLLVSLVTAVIGFKLISEPFNSVCKCKTKLDGKVVLVTGGNTGLGLETARDLASRGARVIIACRNKEKSKEAIEDIVNTTGNDKVEYRHLDLSKFSSVRKFADDFNKNVDRLDVLVNNAGMAGGKQYVTEDGNEIIQQTNFLGGFLLTNLLLDKLIASKPSRIVMVSSVLHHFALFDVDDLSGLKPKALWRRYSRSKLCQIIWAKALARRLPKGVTANALHPGLVRTDIYNNLHYLHKKIMLIFIDLLFKNAKEGAQTSIHLCVAPELENVTGEYFSDCKKRWSSIPSRNSDSAEKLWTGSLTLTKMDPFVINERESIKKQVHFGLSSI